MLKLTRTISLDSLGDLYKDISLVFNCIPARDFPELDTKQKEAQDDVSKQIPFFISILEEYFVSGSQGSESIAKEDMGLLDSDALIYVFKILAGAEIDPKSETPLTSISSTEQE